MYRAKTGYTYDTIRPVRFFRLADIIGPHKYPRCHWYNVDPSKPKYPKAMVTTLKSTKQRKQQLFVNQLPADKVTGLMNYTDDECLDKVF